MRALVCLFTRSCSPCRPAAQDKKEVDLALALGIDISGSIDPDEARLQREGYVQAFRDPVIVKAILGGPNGRIAVAYFEWSDSWMQKLLIDWTLLDSEAAIRLSPTRLADAPISIARRTSISGAIRYAIPLFGRSPYEAQRKVLDISGDGSNNDGGLVTEMRHEALKERIIINGLPIMNDRPNPSASPTSPISTATTCIASPAARAPSSRWRAASRTFPARCARSSCRKWPMSVRGRISTSADWARLRDGTQLAQTGRRPRAGATKTTTPSSCGPNTSSAATSASAAAANSGSAASA